MTSLRLSLLLDKNRISVLAVQVSSSVIRISFRIIIRIQENESNFFHIIVIFGPHFSQLKKFNQLKIQSIFTLFLRLKYNEGFKFNKIPESYSKFKIMILHNFLISIFSIISQAQNLAQPCLTISLSSCYHYNLNLVIISPFNPFIQD